MKKSQRFIKINSAVCRSCVNSRLGWNEWDEKVFQGGAIFCPVEKIIWQIADGMPEECLFKLEMVLEGEVKPKKSRKKRI